MNKQEAFWQRRYEYLHNTVHRFEDELAVTLTERDELREALQDADKWLKRARGPVLSSSWDLGRDRALEAAAKAAWQQWSAGWHGMTWEALPDIARQSGVNQARAVVAAYEAALQKEDKDEQ